MCRGAVSWFTFPPQTQCSGRSHGRQRSWRCSGAEPKPKGGLECWVVLLSRPAGAFLLNFLVWISNYVKRYKLDGWCHKVPRARLLVKSRCSMEMAHQTTVAMSYHTFLFPQSSGLLSSTGKAERTRKEVPRVRKGASTQLLSFHSAFLFPTLQILMR